MIDRSVEVCELPLVDSERHVRFNNGENHSGVIREGAAMSKFCCYVALACLLLVYKLDTSNSASQGLMLPAPSPEPCMLSVAFHVVSLMSNQSVQTSSRSSIRLLLLSIFAEAVLGLGRVFSLVVCEHLMRRLAPCRASKLHSG